MKNKNILKYTNRIFVGIILISTLFSCKKNSEEIKSNELINIKGVAFFNDFYLNPPVLTTFKNVAVFIRADTLGSSQDTSNYFYSTQTDKDGNFNFYITDSSYRYEIFVTANITSSNSFSPRYYGSIVTDSPYNSTKTYQVIASVDIIHGNGLNIVSQDINGQTIPGAKVFLYTSGILAQSDSSFTGVGSVYKFITDSLGKAFVPNLPPGKLYINAELSLTDSTAVKQRLANVDIGSGNITSVTLTLK